jgi:hypothetical protein
LVPTLGSEYQHKQQCFVVTLSIIDRGQKVFNMNFTFCDKDCRQSMAEIMGERAVFRRFDGYNGAP